MSIIYLDNAATSFPKPQNVTRAVADSLMMCGNPGRSGHELSLYSAKAVYSCREAICNFFSFNHPENVVFTYNTTYALNLAINGLYRGGKIIISNLEHNSVVRPVAKICKKYHIFDALGDEDEVIRSFEGAALPNVKMAVITMCSNVTGKLLPIEKIGKICKEKGITLILDAAQCAGLIPIDLSKLYFSAICFAGHKSLYGIMGSGFCIFGKGTEPSPLIVGGNGIESESIRQTGLLPEVLESGTVGVPSIIALKEGIKHLQVVGLAEIRHTCKSLEKNLTEQLLSESNIKIIGGTKGKVSTILFNIDGIGADKVASLLSDSGICVRSGLHCAPIAHKSLGTLDTGGVRISISHFNTAEDIERAGKKIREISKMS